MEIKITNCDISHNNTGIRSTGNVDVSIDNSTVKHNILGFDIIEVSDIDIQKIRDAGLPHGIEDEILLIKESLNILIDEKNKSELEKRKILSSTRLFSYLNNTSSAITVGTVLLDIASKLI